MKVQEGVLGVGGKEGGLAVANPLELKEHCRYSSKSGQGQTLRNVLPPSLLTVTWARSSQFPELCPFHSFFQIHLHMSFQSVPGFWFERATDLFADIRDLVCRCKWQFSQEVLVAIGSFSDLHSQGLQVLRKPHLTGSLVRVIFNLRCKCQSVIVLQTERAFACKAEDSQRQLLVQQKSSSKKEMGERTLGTQRAWGSRVRYGTTQLQKSLAF